MVIDFCFPFFSCTWYEDCLSRYKYCNSRHTSDAYSYSKTFCKLQNNQDFNRKLSSAARQWIEDTSKCIQVSLSLFIVDLLIIKAIA